MEEYIYEIVDYTDDERYYPLAIFETLEQAEKEIEKYGDDPVSEWTTECYEKIVIIERKIGWSGNGKYVVIVEREEKYNEEKDEYYWKTCN